MFLLIGMSYIQFVGYVIPGLSEIMTLKPEEAAVFHVGLMWVPIVGFILVASNICLAVNIVKPLKAWSESALTFGFAASLATGVILGAVIGLVGVLSKGDITQSLIGFTFGICLCLITGIGVGLHKEFQK